MCSFAFTRFGNFFFFSYMICFTFFFYSLYILIQALSLSACNNVNLFITEMEQGKHL